MNLGTGNISVCLRPDASYEINAETGAGSVSIDGFPKMEFTTQHSFLMSIITRAVLNGGAGMLSLQDGVGNIDVRPSQ